MSAEHFSNDFVGGDGYSQVGSSAEGRTGRLPSATAMTDCFVGTYETFLWGLRVWYPDQHH